jgi:hypothetical protein
LSAPRRTKVASLGHGRGSLWARASGSYYRVYSADGKQHEVRLEAHKTGALEEITDRNQKQDNGRLVRPSTITFSEVAAEFLGMQRGLLEEGRRSTRTVQLYEQRIENDLTPALGAKRFQQVSPNHLSGLLSDLRSKQGRGGRMSSNTRAGILRLASVIFSFGVSRGYRADNPTRYLATQERPEARPTTKARAVPSTEPNGISKTARMLASRA